MVTSLNPLRAINPRQSLTSIVVHVVSRVLRVSMGLVEVYVFTKRSLGHPRLKKKKKKHTHTQLIKSTYLIDI